LEDASADEYNSVDELVDALIEDLIARDIIFIEVDAIKDKDFIALGHCLGQ
jgi:hypothetical protein